MPEFSRSLFFWASVRLYISSLSSRIQRIATINLRAPAGLTNPDIAGGCLAPNGDKVALLIGYNTPSQERDASLRAYSLWVCRLDGSSMREVGAWIEHTNPNHILDMDGLRWLPSERQLSFVYNHALWTVPAE